MGLRSPGLRWGRLGRRPGLGVVRGSGCPEVPLGSAQLADVELGSSQMTGQLSRRSGPLEGETWGLEPQKIIKGGASSPGLLHKAPPRATLRNVLVARACGAGAPSGGGGLRRERPLLPGDLGSEDSSHCSLPAARTDCCQVNGALETPSSPPKESIEFTYVFG